ncbi:Hypothetical predicted protein [Olea europaea subsp. europaea]|uniref:Uncharacterized protein n=1 Tax=Olea europaea subsp. europaea TaxID=158383 RepID=A0A8S0TKS1_OLEEU|nr:Hypothetical predicted protein [Olea europaea subsp. europaea]
MVARHTILSGWSRPIRCAGKAAACCDLPCTTGRKALVGFRQTRLNLSPVQYCWSTANPSYPQSRACASHTELAHGATRIVRRSGHCAFGGVQVACKGPAKPEQQNALDGLTL